MSMMEKGVLMIVLGLAGLIYILPLIAGIYMERQDRRKRGEPDSTRAQYDERQKLIRLKASEHALYILTGYLLVWLVVEAMDLLHWEDRTVGLLAGGLLLAFTVWNSECILRGAMLGFNQRKNEGGQIAMYLIVGVCWMFMGCVNLDGALSGSPGFIQLLLGGSWCIMGVLMLYARRRRTLAERGLDAGDGGE